MNAVKGAPYGAPFVIQGYLQHPTASNDKFESFDAVNSLETHRFQPKTAYTFRHGALTFIRSGFCDIGGVCTPGFGAGISCVENELGVIDDQAVIYWIVVGDDDGGVISGQGLRG